MPLMHYANVEVKLVVGEAKYEIAKWMTSRIHN